jgi:hypothetical protein
MNTTLEPSQTKPSPRPPTRPKFVDISRGARLHRMSEQVYLDSRALDLYNEIDTCLGRNLVGCVLSVLAQHASANPGGGADEHLPVAARRRDDGGEVEMLLSLSRSRRSGQLALVLTHAGDRAVD